MLPALRFQIVGMDVVAAADRGNDAAYILAVLDDSVAHREVSQGNLVPDRNVLIRDGAQLAIVFGYYTEELRSGRETLDHHHANVVPMVVHEQVRFCVHSVLPWWKAGMLHKI